MPSRSVVPAGHDNCSGYVVNLSFFQCCHTSFFITFLRVDVTNVKCDTVDRALMLAVSHARRVQVWHVGKVNGTVAYSSVTAGTTEMACFDGDIIDLSFTPDATAIAVASLDGYVTIFDVSRPIFCFHYIINKKFKYFIN